MAAWRSGLEEEGSQEGEDGLTGRAHVEVRGEREWGGLGWAGRQKWAEQREKENRLRKMGFAPKKKICILIAFRFSEITRNQKDFQKIPNRVQKF